MRKSSLNTDFTQFSGLCGISAVVAMNIRTALSRKQEDKYNKNKGFSEDVKSEARIFALFSQSVPLSSLVHLPSVSW